ncbi:MAG: IclR family transcriptional regulator [Pseudonocardia sp.]
MATAGTGSASADSGPSSVLGKAFEVLGCFTPAQRRLSLSEIARKSALPKSTVHRLLAMLLQVGAVERCGTQYRLGVRIFAMGSSSAEAGLQELARPHLERLRRRAGVTVHLGVLRGGDVVYVDRLRARSAPACPTMPGARLPAYCTAVGKAMLAWAEPLPTERPLVRRTTRTAASTAILAADLEAVRRTGTAVDREEALVGVACVAVPILVSARPIAAVSVTFAAAAGSGESLVVPLRETTAAIQRAVSSAGGPQPLLDLVAA